MTTYSSLTTTNTPTTISATTLLTSTSSPTTGITSTTTDTTDTPLTTTKAHTAQITQTSCDLLLNGDCLILNTTRSNWYEAESSCLRWGGHLTSVNNNEEQVAINQLRNGTAIWIGLNDIMENNYAWIDGSNSSYRKWNTENGQPGNSNHSENPLFFQNCAVMEYENDVGYWGDGWCYRVYSFYYICRKYDQDHLVSNCSIRLNGYCIIMSTNRYDWYEAELACMEWGGHLTSIRNTKEQEALNTLRNGNIVWIGLHAIGNGGNYIWTDGVTTNYTNWATGQPNNLTTASNYKQDCIAMDRNLSIGYWRDEWCIAGEELSFVCRKKYQGISSAPSSTAGMTTDSSLLTTNTPTTISATTLLTSTPSSTMGITTTITTDTPTTISSTIKFTSTSSSTSITLTTTTATTDTPLTTTNTPTTMSATTLLTYTPSTMGITTNTTYIPLTTTKAPTDVQPPQIQNPQTGTIIHLNITANSSFRLVCNATDDNPITYSWIYNNTKSTIARSSELSLNSAQLSSIIDVDAVYICIATNSYSSMNASITVKVSLQSGILNTISHISAFESSEILAVSNILISAANRLIEAETTGEAKEETLGIYVKTYENIVNSIRNASYDVEQVSAVLDLGVSLLGASENLLGEEYIPEETEQSSTLSGVSLNTIRILQSIENVSNSVGSALEDTTNKTSIRISSQNVRLIAQKIPFSVYNIDTSGNDSSDATENTIILPDYGDEINTEDQFKYEIPSSVAKSLAKENGDLNIVTTIVMNIFNRRGEVSSRRVQTISDIVLITVISRSNITQTTFKAPVKMKFYISNIDHASKKLTCGFLKVKSQIWSTSGVSTNLEAEAPPNSTNRLFPVYCNTDHFTSFAVLISPRKIEPPEPEKLALSITSCVLVSISIIFLICTLIIFCCSYKRFFKVETNIIYFNYGLAILFGMVSFLISVSLHELIKNNILVGVVADNICKAAAVFSNYSWLAVYSWTLSNGVYVVYKLILGAMSNAKVYLWFMLFGWLSPVLLVVITLSVKFDVYSDASEHCFPSYKYGVIWGQIGPILFILFVNSILLVLATAKIYKTTKSGGDKQQDMKAIKSAVISMCILTPIFGLPWIFLIPVLFWDSTIPVWIFTISCSSLGVLYFLVVFLRNKEVRDTILQRKHTKHDTSTYSTSKTGSLTAKYKCKKMNKTFSESIDISETEFTKSSQVKVAPKLVEYTNNPLYYFEEDNCKYQNISLSRIIEGNNKSVKYEYSQLRSDEDYTITKVPEDEINPYSSITNEYDIPYASSTDKEMMTTTEINKNSDKMYDIFAPKTQVDQIDSNYANINDDENTQNASQNLDILYETIPN